MSDDDVPDVLKPFYPELAELDESTPDQPPAQFTTHFGKYPIMDEQGQQH